MARKYRNFVYDENQRFIYPTSDWGFKYLLGSEANKDLLLGVLRELLPNFGIESVDFLPLDITIPIGKMKDMSFDVYCTLKDGSRMVVEMQNYARPTFVNRALVYSSAAVLEHFVNSKAKSYQIGKTIFIAFLGDPIFRNVDRTPIRLGLCDVDEEKTTMRNKNLLQIFVELPKFAGTLESINERTPFIEKLSYVMMEMADCQEIPDNLHDPLLEKIFKAADTKIMDKNTKEDYMKSIIGEFDYEASLEDAKEEGLERGREEGLERGREEGVALVAKNLKAQGVDVNVIVQCTGLTKEQIESL